MPRNGHCAYPPFQYALCGSHPCPCRPRLPYCAKVWSFSVWLEVFSEHGDVSSRKWGLAFQVYLCASHGPTTGQIIFDRIISLSVNTSPPIYPLELKLTLTLAVAALVLYHSNCQRSFSHRRPLATQLQADITCDTYAQFRFPMDFSFTACTGPTVTQAFKGDRKAVQEHCLCIS